MRLPRPAGRRRKVIRSSSAGDFHRRAHTSIGAGRVCPMRALRGFGIGQLFHLDVTAACVASVRTVCGSVDQTMPSVRARFEFDRT